MNDSPGGSPLSFLVNSLVSGGTSVARERLVDAIGWELTPQGLCQGDVCVPVNDTDALLSSNGDRVDLFAVAEALDRPVVHDPIADIVAVGAPRASRRQAINDLVAPDFSLPDLTGSLVALNDFKGKKKLLVAFSSW